ncbi:MAG TPA: copper transporter [Oscillospiraceae bacterium]|nr:copper transporter [Oscillospiraceae bacterium]
MFRLRDQIISLVAVFLALGIGIIIGTGLTEDMLVTQQRLLIDQLTSDFQLMREERSQLQANVQALTQDLSLWDQYHQVLYPNIVAGVLSDKNIAVVAHAASIPPNLLTLLQDAQAMLCSVIRIEDRTVLGSDTKNVGQALGTLTMAGQCSQVMEEQLADFLAKEAIKIEIQPTAKPDTLLLLVGERQDLDRSLLAEMTEVCQQAGVTLVGLEWSNVKNSALTELKQQGVSTIDNVETVFGQYSLLSVLRGSSGNFGIKQAAEEFIAIY